MKYVNSMDAMYKGNKFRTVAIESDWHYADAWQLKDYTDLGGTGIPEMDTNPPAATPQKVSDSR
jgi:hypothetical protein